MIKLTSYFKKYGDMLSPKIVIPLNEQFIYLLSLAFKSVFDILR